MKRYQIMSNKSPMVYLTQREVDHYRLDLAPGFHQVTVTDETASGEAAIARAKLCGRSFEIINHNRGGNPSYLIAELCDACEDGDVPLCEFCDSTGYRREQPPKPAADTRLRRALNALAPKEVSS